MAITGAPSAVQAIFALDIVTAALALILCILSIFLASRKQTYRALGGSSSNSGRRSSPKGTYAFLIPGALCLGVAYAVQSASVARAYNSGSSAPVTKAFSYAYGDSASTSGSSGGTSSDLSFANGFCTIFATILLNGAVWLHSSHVTSNGTGIGEPSVLSIIWNTIILGAMAATGLASWGLALDMRDASLTYPMLVDYDMTSRALYITFRCLVIVASISVSVEAIRRYRQVNADGLPGNSERPILARLAFFGVPVFLLRDVFIIVDIVMFYVSRSEEGWSGTSGQAVAFLLIIFGQIANLTIYTIVAWGAWSMGRISR